MTVRAEIRWMLAGPVEEVALAASALAGFCTPLRDELLELDFGNSVGRFHLGLGDVSLEVVSGKWDGSHFEAMLEDVSRVAAGLPFAADKGGALPYDRRLAARTDILYHAFVYLRHILLGEGAPESRLIPALDVILREPHRVWRRTTSSVPVEASRVVDVRGLVRLAQGREPLVATTLGLPLTRMLRGHMPTRVEESRVNSTLNTPENRFVLNFLDVAERVVSSMLRSADQHRGGESAIARRVKADGERMAQILERIRRDGRWLWDELDAMTYLPLGSTVLQMRRGYRDVLRHFIRLHAATRLPISAHDARQLLELKDIALLYELWTFFSMVEAIQDRVGPPVRTVTFGAKEEWEQQLGRDMVVGWADGLTLAYNRPFWPGARDPWRRSYSVGLRPDIALTVPEGPGKGLHLLDAKFRLRHIADLTGQDRMAAEDGESEGTVETEERRGTFKRDDLYKMHTYRDAIHRVRSVWILYPGDEARFFPATEGMSIGNVQLPETAAQMDGVGALPLVPEEGGRGCVDKWLRRVLEGHVGQDVASNS